MPPANITVRNSTGSVTHHSDEDGAYIGPRHRHHRHHHHHHHHDVEDEDDEDDDYEDDEEDDDDDDEDDDDGRDAEGDDGSWDDIGRDIAPVNRHEGVIDIDPSESASRSRRRRYPSVKPPPRRARSSRRYPIVVDPPPGPEPSRLRGGKSRTRRPRSEPDDMEPDDYPPTAPRNYHPGAGWDRVGIGYGGQARTVMSGMDPFAQFGFPDHFSPPGPASQNPFLDTGYFSRRDNRSAGNELMRAGPYGYPPYGYPPYPYGFPPYGQPHQATPSPRPPSTSKNSNPDPAGTPKPPEADPKLVAIEKLLEDQRKREEAREQAQKQAAEDKRRADEDAKKKAEEDKILGLQKLLIDYNSKQLEREKAADEKAKKEAAEKAAAELKALELKKANDEKNKEIKFAAEKAKMEAEKEAAAKAAEAKEKHDKEMEEAKKKAAELEAGKKKAEEEAAALKPKDDMLKPPIKFKDAVGRKFSFPWHICKTWKGMETLINQAFLHVDDIGQHVHEGHYDLIGPDGEIILPQVWETMVKPDWSISMHMWPIEPPRPPGPPMGPGGMMPPGIDMLPPPGAKKGKGKKEKKGGGHGHGPIPPPPFPPMGPGGPPGLPPGLPGLPPGMLPPPGMMGPNIPPPPPGIPGVMEMPPAAMAAGAMMGPPGGPGASKDKHKKKKHTNHAPLFWLAGAQPKHSQSLKSGKKHESDEHGGSKSEGPASKPDAAPTRKASTKGKEMTKSLDKEKVRNAPSAPNGAPILGSSENGRKEIPADQCVIM